MFLVVVALQRSYVSAGEHLSRPCSDGQYCFSRNFLFDYFHVTWPAGT